MIIYFLYCKCILRNYTMPDGLIQSSFAIRTNSTFMERLGLGMGYHLVGERKDTAYLPLPCRHRVAGLNRLNH